MVDDCAQWSIQMATNAKAKPELHDVRFPGESSGYREARNKLLEAEIELRRRVEELLRSGASSRSAARSLSTMSSRKER
jgi:hypothetical protein